MKDLKKIRCIRKNEVKRSYGIMRKLVSVLGLLAMSVNAGLWEESYFGSAEQQPWLVLNCVAGNMQAPVTFSHPDAATMAVRFFLITVSLLIVISIGLLFNSLLAGVVCKFKIRLDFGNALSTRINFVGHFVSCAAIALVGIVISAVTGQWLLGGNLHFSNSPFNVALGVTRSFLLTAFVLACPLYYTKVLTVTIAAMYLLTVAVSVIPVAFDCSILAEVHSRCGTIGAGLQRFTLFGTFFALTGILPLILYVLLFYKAISSRKVSNDEDCRVGRKCGAKLIFFLIFFFVSFVLFGAVVTTFGISVYPSNTLWLYLMNNITLNTFNLCYVLAAAFLTRNRGTWRQTSSIPKQ